MTILTVIRPIAVCLFFFCFSFTAIGQSSSSTVLKEPISTAQSTWVSNSQNLVKKLLDLANNLPETDEIHPSSDDPEEVRKEILMRFRERDDQKKIDDVLWNLWLITGMPPLVRDENLSLRKYVETNASAFKKYINEHAELNDEELQRIGIKNTVKSIGSPLWYMTMQYLKQKAGVEFDIVIIIRVTPDHVLIEKPLSHESYTHLSDATSRWLDLNKKGMIWDSRRCRFSPRNEKYVGTEELAKVILESAETMGKTKKSKDGRGEQTSR